MAVKNGDFNLDSVTVQGNATLFEGNSIETEAGLARLYLQTGARIQLAAESRTKSASGTIMRSSRRIA